MSTNEFFYGFSNLLGIHFKSCFQSVLYLFWKAQLFARNVKFHLLANFFRAFREILRSRSCLGQNFSPKKCPLLELAIFNVWQRIQES